MNKKSVRIEFTVYKKTSKKKSNKFNHHLFNWVIGYKRKEKTTKNLKYIFNRTSCYYILCIVYINLYIKCENISFNYLAFFYANCNVIVNINHLGWSNFLFFVFAVDW